LSIDLGFLSSLGLEPLLHKSLIDLLSLISCLKGSFSLVLGCLFLSSFLILGVLYSFFLSKFLFFFFPFLGLLSFSLLLGNCVFVLLVHNLVNRSGVTRWSFS